MININYQEFYSRGELLLRSIFGIFYIFIPHYFCLFFLTIWGTILQFLTFWVILFAGRFPENWFDYQLKLRRWGFRVQARAFNMADDYPAFGLSSTDDHTIYEVEYNEHPDRLSVLLRAVFGFLYVYIPHGIILFILAFVVQLLLFLSWWAVLFTGRYPKGFFDFNLNFLRWSARVDLYMSYMTDRYPPFSLEDAGQDYVPQGSPGYENGKNYNEKDLV